jgi:endonuclease/exonuclease/phosphatase family metal-dependent hydrolase
VAYVVVNGITIANTHLQGGRFVDREYEKHLSTKSHEIIQILQEIKPDVIVGDFNGGKRPHAHASLQTHPIYTELSTIEQSRFVDYYSGVHDTLQSIGYSSAYEEKDVGTTSFYGGVPDWVYIKDSTTKVHGGPQVLSEILNDQLSDHAGVIVKIRRRSVV